MSNASSCRLRNTWDRRTQRVPRLSYQTRQACGLTMGCPALHEKALANSGMLLTTPLMQRAAATSVMASKSFTPRRVSHRRTDDRVVSSVTLHDRPLKAMACPTGKVHLDDWAHAEDEHSGAGQGESGGHHEGQVELAGAVHHRSEEHTSELQSLRHLVCRLLL